jgi:predicted metal-dependent phosphoesterase TrpH
VLKVEFHCHSIYSKDSLLRPEDLLEACRRKGIDRVVITEHNNIEGALRARELDPQRVIVGEEIMTQSGELLAAFVTEEVPRGLLPQEAIARLRQQGAFISVSHPFDILRSGHWEEPDLLAILPQVDAIETFNARCMRASFNQQAQEFARQHNLVGTVGSDAHTAFELGKACLLLPDFTDANSLRQVLPQGEPQVSLSSPLIHFTSRYAVWRKKGNAAKRSGSTT